MYFLEKAFTFYIYFLRKQDCKVFQPHSCTEIITILQNNIYGAERDFLSTEPFILKKVLCKSKQVKLCAQKIYKLRQTKLFQRQKTKYSAHMAFIFLFICNWFLQFASLKYQVWWTWLLVYFKCEFHRLQQAEKSSTN